MLQFYNFKSIGNAGHYSKKRLLTKTIKALIIIITLGLCTTKIQAQSNCVDPGTEPGDIGCVTVSYMGEIKTYTTVRANDGLIWLQQNLGSEAVAAAINDETAYGGYFQWGRWADGHQLSNSQPTTIPDPNNPAGITTESIGFYTGSTAWWAEKQMTDTWNANTPEEVTSVNGCDPCKALGSEWKIPSQAEWETVNIAESMENPAAAYASHLVLPAAGNRGSSGSFSFVGARDYYWSTTTATTGGKHMYISDFISNPSAGGTRGQGMSIRCVKSANLGIGDFGKIKLSLYPNPTTASFHINTTETITQVTVNNMLGQQVWSGKSADINLSNVIVGVYLVRVLLGNNEVIIQKIIKK